MSLKYFTKDWYKEMQISGFVKFIESIEEWEEVEQEYIQSLKEGRLLNFLPETLHPYIHNNTINSECPLNELKKLLLEWNERLLEKNNSIRSILLRTL